jgi:acyl-[acyl-carrier-protein]-phospholipid O-acyltransferase / long-chain-fatty-acid--[acyl-carrier-protein] ligase
MQEPSVPMQASATNAAPHASACSGPPLDLRDAPATLAEALEQARRRHGGGRIVLEGHEQDQLSYDRLMLAAHALAGRIRTLTTPGERVGVMLPTSLGAVIAFFALHLAGRTPAMLNYAAGAKSVQAACELAKLRLVLTSRRFIKAAQLGDLITALSGQCKIVELETVRDGLTPLDKARAFVAAHIWAPRPRGVARDPAVILFTSGTTGAPKAVVLSHENLIANVEQCRRHARFEPDWVFFNTLPMFHAFGLTGGALLPLLSGLKTVLYPSPLHHERIPAMIAATGANVLISTDTFAAHYVRSAHPGALKSLSMVVLGAERVREATRAAFRRACGAVLLEGYGATECAPVVAVNQPDFNRDGTVGRLLPGVEARLVPFAGVAQGGRLEVRGPNIMRGYLRETEMIEAPPEGWFDTGDLASIDTEGFVTILGRTKRFVKIGAEMVSLAAVEAHAQEVWPDARHAALAVAGEDRSEELVLVTDQAGARRDALVEHAKANGAPHIELPRRVVIVPAVPILPTGKTDYGAALAMAERPASAEAKG